MRTVLGKVKLLFFAFILMFFCALNHVFAIDYINQTSDSLLDWLIQENGLTEGYYKVTCNGVDYTVHLYVYNGDQTWTSNKNFGDANDVATDSRNAVNMVAVKVRGNLTINSGVLVQAYKTWYGSSKGFFLFVSGQLNNAGTIRARGAKAAGQTVYLYKDPINGYTGFTVPAAGAAGATRSTTEGTSNNGKNCLNGNAGKAGTGRQTGGGGSGSVRNYVARMYPGSGAAGTSYSGGTGGGAAATDRASSRTAGNGGANGGAGGCGAEGGAATCNSGGSTNGWGQAAGGGQGNGPGNSVASHANFSIPDQDTGTGGLLILFAGVLNNTGNINTNGVAARYFNVTKWTGSQGGGHRLTGGSSGGGSTNIFYSMLQSKGTITASGGAAQWTGGVNWAGGAGGAGTVNLNQVVLEEEYLHPTLSSLTVNGKDVTPSFTPENTEYSFKLDKDNFRVNIAAELTNLDNELTDGIGWYDIPAGTYTHTITITSYIGIVKNYTIEFYRPPTSYKYLNGFKINDEELEGFSPSKMTYNVNVDSTVETLNIEAILGRPSQTVSGDGELTIKSGLNVYEISVMSEDMTSTVIYTINVYKERSTLLKVLNFENFDLLDPSTGEPVEFDPHVKEYTLEIFAGTLSLNTTATPYDSDAKVTLFGLSYIRKSINAKVTVSLDGFEDTVYTIHVLKGDDDIDVEETFDYTGQYQSFEVPYSAFYKIELWGAQGGNSKGNNSQNCSYNRGKAYGGGCGGFGAYTSGWIFLRKEIMLYFYIGQRGSDAKSYNNVSESWNGGGSATYDHSDDEASGAGGGASDVRLVHTSSRTTWDGLDSLKSRIMVAAGGGGGSDVYAGGNGGTLSSSNVRFASGVTQTSGYRFGKGENGVFRATNYDVAGGGSGYFGGYSTAMNSNNYRNWGHTGSGGSSYVSGCTGCKSVTEDSTSFDSLSFTDNVHYSTYKFKNIQMLSGGVNQPTSSAGYTVGHSGNGYGKITMLNLNENNYLNTLTIYNTTKTTTVYKTYAITENSDGTSTPIDENINIEVPSDMTSVKLNGRPDDDAASLSGNGRTYDIDVGVNVFTISVVAENNDERVYTISITREADTNKYPNNITILGLVRSLCTQKDGLCELADKDGNELSAWNKNIDEYTITVPSRIKQLKWDVDKAQVHQVIVGDLVTNLSSGTNMITLEVKSEYCSLNYTDEEISQRSELTEQCVSSYRYNVYRDVTDDSDLEYLYIDQNKLADDDSGKLVDFDLNYTDYDVYNYYFSVPSDWTYVKELVAIADAASDGATVEITGNEEGAFAERGQTYLVSILVTAPDRVSTSTYRLHVYRELDSNIYITQMNPYLDSISDSNLISLDKEFNKTLFDYNITIENDKNGFKLITTTDVSTTSEAITINNNAQVSTTSSVIQVLKNGENANVNKYESTISNLKTGYTTLTIVTTSERSETGTYTLTIFRKYNSDSTLSSITVSNGGNTYSLTPEFNPNTYTYDVTTDPDITSISYIGTATKTTSTIKYVDKNTIKLGTNVKSILVTAEDGSYSIYTLNIIRPASQNNNFATLKVKGSNSVEYGVDLTDEPPYNITVPNNVTYVNISGTTESQFAKTKGLGRYYLSTQTVNNIIVSVTAEDGTNKAYEFNITRLKNSNAYLSGIGVTNASLNETFNSNNLDYTITVPYSTDYIKLNYSRPVSTTTVTMKDNNDNVVNPKDKINLSTGTVTYKFITLAEDGTTTLTYTVTITKTPCTINTLRNIYVNEATVRPTFTSNNSDYTIRVPYDISEVNFVVVKEHSSETYAYSSSDTELVINGDKISGLKMGDNEVLITVTPEAGEANIYTFTIVRQPEGTASNYLSSLTLSRGTLSPAFNKSTPTYTVTVPYEISSTTVSYTLEDVDATATGAGTYSLKVGEETVVSITVTATDGYTRDYIIRITREKSTDATLSNLSVNRANLTPGFNSNIVEYDLTTSNTSLVFDSIIPTMQDATYEVNGNDENTFLVNENIYDVTIEVTAPDKVTKKTYTIHVKKVASKNYNLESLSVEGYSISPTFNPNTTSYTLTVPSDVTNVLIEATAQDSKSSIDGIGVTELDKGVNYRYVKVTAEDGTVKSYVILITREYSSNNKIKNLILNNAKFVDSNEDETTFDSDTLSYNVTFEALYDSLDMEVILDDPTATYVISGNDFKDKETGVVTITVTAENGTSRVYTLNVTKKNVKSGLLSDLYDRTYGINPEFNMYVNNYNLVVDYEYTSLNLYTKTVDKYAEVVVIDNNLNVGINTVIVRVTSSGEDPIVNDYKINVTRNPEVDNFLDYMYTDYGTGDFNENFDKRTINYSLTVSTDTTSIILYGEPYTKKSIVTTVYNGTETQVIYDDSNTNTIGTFDLVKGTNTIYIKVSLDSVVRTYKVVINRSFENDSNLYDLEVSYESTKYQLTPEFDPNTKNYTLNVGVDIYNLTFNGNVSSTSTVEGLGDYELKGGANTITIRVTAEDGTYSDYTITVNKTKSSNAYLVDLIPSDGELEPTFTYSNNVYTMNFDSSVSTLSFEYITEDMNAKVTGNDLQVVPDGTSTRTITVTAEDGTTTRVYTITLNKIVSNDAYLKSLAFKGYNFVNSESPSTKVNFNKDTFEYYVHVPNDKQTVSINDFTYQLNDDSSTVTYSSIIKLSTKNYVQFKFNVTAEDGFTENVYVVNVLRGKSSNSALASLVVNYGYLTQGFSPTTYSYDWYVPLYASYLNDSSVSADLDDPNASLTKSDPFEAKTSKEGELSYLVTVTSEDGESTTVYSLRVYIDASSDTSLKEVDINEGYIDEELSSDLLEYTVHVYDNATKVKITGVPTSEYATITSDMTAFLLDLNAEYTEKEITVVAEDGETSSTYKFKVYRDINSSQTLKNIGLNGLDKLDTCSSKICSLTPTFSENVLEYKIVVPYEYNLLDVFYELNNDQQTVKLRIDETEINNKEYDLPTGESDLYITVYDKLGKEGKTYKVVVKRNLSSNAHLSNIVLSSTEDGNYTLSPTFDRDTFEYKARASVGVTTLSIEVTPEESGATYKTRGLTNLAEGNNTVQITVTAPDRLTKLYYYITVQIKPAVNAYLTDISVFSGVFYDLSPQFDESTFSYTSEVASYSEYVLLEATSDSTKKINVTGTGEYTIETGINIFNITSELLDENDNVLATKVYTINVIRPVSSNVFLKDLKVTSKEETKLLNNEGYYDLSPKFDKGTTDYRITVSPGIKKLDITAPPGNDSFKVRIYGNNLATGVNYVDVIVNNEDKTVTKTYQIKVTRLPSENSNLKSINILDKNSVSYGIKAEDFDPLVTLYNVTVPYHVDRASIYVETEDPAATPSGYGEYYLSYGNNTIEVEVVAEDGEHTSTYTINIYREYDLYLRAINEDNEDSNINEEFVKTNNNYTMNVENDVKSVIIEGIPEEDNVEVIYTLDSGTAVGGEIIDGKLYTGVGTNKVLITVKAPDNTTNTYHLDVIRKQSDNNYLSALDFNEGNLNEVFVKTDNSYTMYILDTYTSISYDNKKDILTEDPTASYTVSGLSNLSAAHDNTVTITVTSQSGKTNIYTVTVMLKPEAWFRHYLQKLELSYKVKGNNNEEITSNVSLSPVFVKEKMAYTATVPYGVSSITVNTQTYIEDDEALLKASTEPAGTVGYGTFALDLGRNVINIKVYSKLSNNDGSYAIYKVIVYRQNNPDATLANLSVTNHFLSPGFNSNTLNYDIDIKTNELSLDIIPVPRDPNATVEITGNGPFSVGDNVIKITVTAADGETKREYKITAHCSLSDINFLSNLEVKDYELEPSFTKINNGVYLVNVDENVTSVYVTGTKEDPSSSLSILVGSNTYNQNSVSVKLTPGNNYIYLSVTSAAGNMRTYTLNVFRSYSTDNTLKDLIISDGELIPEFDPEVTDYTVNLDGDLAFLNNVSVIGFKNHSKAKLTGNGEYTLETGITDVSINVTSEAGQTRTYKIHFIKKDPPSSKILMINVYEGELEPEFNKDGYKYYITVPYEITELDFDTLDNIILEDEEATYEILNNSDFKVGINVVTIKVTATDEETSKYYIYVTRSIDGNTYLQDLYVDNQTLSPVFDEDTLYYELSVSSSIDSIFVNATAQNVDASVAINGTSTNRKAVPLTYGENKVYVNVLTPTGAERTYVIKVTRLLNEDNYMLTLTSNIGTWDKTFDKETTDYTITVPKKTKSITLSGTASVGSTITGLGSFDLNVGDNNLLVSVTNDSGLVNTYTLKVVKPGNNDASLDSITSDQGDLTLENGTYKIYVDNDITSIKFIVTPHDSDATVEMKDVYNLNFNANNFEIIIRAEDGETTNTIPIYVYRYKQIESVNIIPDQIAVNVAEDYQVEYEYTPENTDYTEFTWSSMNPDVATVDSTGKITGVSEGITYVYITSTVADAVNDYVLVYVSSKYITSDIYTVWHVGDSDNEMATVNFNYVIGANDKTTYEEFKYKFNNNPDNLVVKSAGEEINHSAYVGTGMTLSLVMNNVVYDEVVIVVRGDNGTVDKPGNGIITSTDYATLSSILAGLTVKTPIVSLLYDLNKNKILTVTDLSPMSLYIAGKATFTNLNGLE